MYRLRFLLTMLGCFLRPPRGLMEPYERRYLALPFLDTDLSRLFTHTYASWMALSRWHFLFSSPFRNAALRRGWAPVTTAETILYQRSIRWFERVTVRTRMLCWTERRFYLEQTFLVRGESRAVCVLEGLVRGPNGVVRPPEGFRELGYELDSPAMPASVRSWVESLPKG